MEPKIFSFFSFFGFFSFSENFQFPDSRAAGRRKLKISAETENFRLISFKEIRRKWSNLFFSFFSFRSSRLTRWTYWTGKSLLSRKSYSGERSFGKTNSRGLCSDEAWGHISFGSAYSLSCGGAEPAVPPSESDAMTILYQRLDRKESTAYTKIPPPSLTRLPLEPVDGSKTWS